MVTSSSSTLLLPHYGKIIVSDKPSPQHVAVNGGAVLHSTLGSTAATAADEDDTTCSASSVASCGAPCPVSLHHERVPMSHEIKVPDAVNTSVPIHSILREDCGHRPTATATHQKHVSFSSVSVRQAASIELGHGQSVCTIGAPVSLSWDYLPEAKFDIDIYEFTRGPRRPVKRLVLNYFQRRDMLVLAGYTMDQIKQASNEAARLRRIRSVTAAVMPALRIQEVVQSAGRKVRKLGTATSGMPKNATRSSGRVSPEHKQRQHPEPADDYKPPAHIASAARAMAEAGTTVEIEA